MVRTRTHSSGTLNGYSSVLANKTAYGKIADMVGEVPKAFLKMCGE
jgi:hypothetical protein